MIKASIPVALLALASLSVGCRSGASGAAPALGGHGLAPDAWRTASASPGPHGPTPASTEPAATPAAAAANRIVMKDNLFEPKDLSAKAGQPFTLTLVNSGLLLHNMHIASAEANYDASEVISDPQFIEQGKTGSLTWTPPAPGIYRFRCDIHADIMSGTITVN